MNGFAPVEKKVATGAEEAVNLPNAITLASYALGVAWAVGGPNWMALASVAADEVDGRLARHLGQTTSLGGQLDWAGDIVLSAMTLRRIDAPVWAYVAALLGQVALRDQGKRPEVGSLRAALMLGAVGYEYVKTPLQKREDFWTKKNRACTVSPLLSKSRR